MKHRVHGGRDCEIYYLSVVYFSFFMLYVLILSIRRSGHNSFVLAGVYWRRGSESQLWCGSHGSYGEGDCVKTAACSMCVIKNAFILCFAFYICGFEVDSSFLFFLLYFTH